jgi:small multidrug resistance family-3 protein
MVIIKSLLVFFLAGLCEIGGGYLIWLWLKENKPWWLGALGAIILALYGVVATWQPASFGRVYAAYGGVFIVMAVLWGWKVEGIKPDKWDVIGAVIAFTGMAIIMFAPRK